MNLGDTIVIRAKAYAVRTIDGVKQVVREYGRVNLFVPYADYTTSPESGELIALGFTTALYDAYQQWCDSFSLMSGVWMDSNSVFLGSYFFNFFPNYKFFYEDFDTSNWGDIVLENSLNGHCVQFKHVSPAQKYETLNDCLSGNSLGGIAPFPWMMDNNGDGSYRGHAFPVIYTSLSDDKKSVTHLSTATFTGVTSTTNRLAIGSWTQYSNNDLTGFNWFVGEVQGIPSGADVDPYSNAGTSSSSGGTGTFSDTSDDIDFPSLPTLSAIGTGFVTLYIPTIAQLSTLANYMWNSNVQTLEFWRKIVADPIDLILGLNIVPFTLPVAGSKMVTAGGVSTDVNMNYTSTQYIEINCGSLTVPEFYGAYLDYSPYTRFEIYLPYCGTHPLVADEIVGKTIAVKYHVDALSGSCVAYVKCGGSVLYEFAGNVCAQIPVTANQFGDMVRSAISIAASIGSMVASEGATAPMAVGAIAATATNSTALKPAVEKSGAIGGMSGQLGIQKPYLIVTRPNLCTPEYQNHFIGYPAFITVDLDGLTGYNEIASIHLENIPATSAELDEIESILKSGVIL